MLEGWFLLICFPESSDSLLTGQRLLDEVVSTSAALHAFASTCKRPPERRDAFTNTDPGGPSVDAVMVFTGL